MAQQLYLSKLVLNARNPAVTKEVNNPYQIHRTIMRAFPVDLSKDERILFRVEEKPHLSILVQSTICPDWEPIVNKEGYVLAEPTIKDLSGLTFQRGAIYRFRLRANPSKKIKDKAGKTHESKRVGIYNDTECTAWLERKGVSAGFSLIVDSLIIKSAPYRTIFIHTANKTQKATINMVDFDGLLRAEDPRLLKQHISIGIGPAKGFGCGLLSAAPG